MEHELEKCPFCGDAEKVEFANDVFGKPYGILYNHCGAITQWPFQELSEYAPVAKNKDIIANLWNRRVET